MLDAEGARGARPCPRRSGAVGDVRGVGRRCARGDCCARRPGAMRVCVLRDVRRRCIGW